MITRDYVSPIEHHINGDDALIQVLIGPRQVGKTTSIEQLIERGRIKLPTHSVSADDALGLPASWIEEQWQRARSLGKKSLLIIDEIQKIAGWSNTIKALWDGQKKTKDHVSVILLGSSSLDLQQGLSESLAGRFELHRAYHWSFDESKRAFDFDVDRFLSYGGYPGSYRFASNFERFHNYIKHSIIETVVGKDILSQRSVRNPALFRQTFELLCAYPAQEISYTKLLGQLQESGNTDLIRHYISLYEGAFLFRALEKYSTNPIKKKSSSPKILPLCPVLHAITRGADAVAEPQTRGRLLEAAVGAELIRLPGELFYWRDGDMEVDFVYKMGRAVYGIEVKSGRRKHTRGLDEFKKRFADAKRVVVRFEDFPVLSRDPAAFLERLGF